MAIASDGERIITGVCVVMYDALTQPDRQPDGSVKYQLKLAIPKNAPEIAELKQRMTHLAATSIVKGLGQKEIAEKFMDIDPESYGDTAHLIADCYHINVVTNLPPVVISNVGQKIDPVEYAGLLYAGCQVRVMIDVYDFGPAKNAKSVGKGFRFGLSSVQIHNAQAPRLEFVGGKGITAEKAANEFAMAAVTTGQAAPAPHHDFVNKPAARVEAPVSAAPAVPPPPPAAVPAPPAASGPVMLKGTATYADMVANGWTHQQLVDHGFVAA